MTIDEIIDYVSNTPENSNPAVLKAMLEQLEGTGDGSGNSGGSSSDVNVIIVNVVLAGNNDAGSYLDKTFNEIASALEQGLVLIKCQKEISVDDETVNATLYVQILDVDLNNKFISSSTYGTIYPLTIPYYYGDSIIPSGSWQSTSGDSNPKVYWD